MFIFIHHTAIVSLQKMVLVSKAVLMHTKTPDGIERFRREIWIADILQEVPPKIIIVIGSGMSDAGDAMSSDSRARADRAYDLFRESSP